MSIPIAINEHRTYKAGKYLVVYVSDPEKSLDLGQQEALLQVLGPAASKGFGHQVTADSLRRHMLIGQNHLFLARAEDTLVGFMSAKNFQGTSVVYLSGVVLSPECQGKGVGSTMIHALLEVTRCSILAFTTQSPAMYSC